jgi:TetR/AcrR family transcriptional repressor of nem operon
MSTPSMKTQVLHQASRMLLARGFHGFSLQELAEGLHIKKASLFHHYPSKKALVIELYRFYQKAFTDWAEKHENLPPEKQLLAYAKKLTTWICEKQRVCPVGALSLEWHLVDPELQSEMKNLHQLHRRWLLELFKNIDVKVPKAQAVSGAMALIQGSIQIARIKEDPRLVLTNLKTYLKSIKA